MRTVGLVHVAWTCRSKNIDLEGWLLVLLLLVTLCRECNVGSQNMSYVGIIHDFNYKWLYNSELTLEHDMQKRNSLKVYCYKQKTN